MSEFIEISDQLFNSIKKAIFAGLEYEKISNNHRRLGITGEVGEILACRLLNLKLSVNPIEAGYDAIDQENRRVQIKTRKIDDAHYKKSKRLGIFSKHVCDVVILVLLNKNYEIYQIWKTDYEKLKPILEKEKRRNPSIHSFLKIAEEIKPDR